MASANGKHTGKRERSTGSNRLVIAVHAGRPGFVPAPLPCVPSGNERVYWRLLRIHSLSGAIKRPGLKVVVNDAAILQDLPYNRWGLAGNFFITKMRRDGVMLNLSDEEAEGVLQDLQTTIGYLDPEAAS